MKESCLSRKSSGNSYINMIAEKLSAKELVDARVFNDRTLADLQHQVDVPASSYIQTYINKIANQDPPFGGYDPLDREKVIALFKDESYTYEEIAEKFHVSLKGLHAYCSLYKVDIRKASLQKVAEMRGKGIGPEAIRRYYGYTQGSMQRVLKDSEYVETEVLDKEAMKKRLENYEKRLMAYTKAIMEVKAQIAEAKKFIEEQED